jgi:VanZ family protein
MKQSSEYKFLGAAVLITLVILYLSFEQLDIPIKDSFSQIDKVKHFSAYFMLMFSWLLVMEKEKRRVKVRFWLFIAVFLFGFFIEILQGTFTVHRTGDFRDVLANTMGAFFALFFYDKLNAFFLKKHPKKTA